MPHPVTQPDSCPRLIFTGTASVPRTVHAFRNRHLTVGRAPECDLRLDDPQVSNVHAVLRRSDGATSLKDKGSTNGTWLNSVRIDGTYHRLRDGDVIRFGSVEAVFHAPFGTTTAVPPRPTPDPPAGPPVPASEAHFNSDRQWGKVINNVLRDQYNHHVQEIHERRDGFLREIAAARTRARWVIAIGLAAFLTGMALGFAVFRRFITGFTADWECIARGDTRCWDGSLPSPFGPTIGGMPLILIAMALNAGGIICMLVGFVRHIVAASRRRSVESALNQPLSPPPIWSP
ncbi:FHA domain-containing protein [Streptomyces sp. NRRL F-5755]|uniref:FHA domain-containing protein n=1 Tax=Streptomyces sp. NRRL F-5755 TaxID=1519475 RepID=UPI0006AF37EC|nr:FHA domain-containing protein [Streptomyces sp. NRRL F-5755]